MFIESLYSLIDSYVPLVCCDERMAACPACDSPLCVFCMDWCDGCDNPVW